jgi:phosphohistidine phosphatase
MRIYLVQHAQSRSKDQDPEQSLSQAGIQAVRDIAAMLSDLQVDRIYHSEKLRARQTAEILAENIHPAGSFEQIEGLKPLDNPTIWSDRLQTDLGDVMLVGHLPHIDRLASLLLTGDPDRSILEVTNAG